MYLYEGVRDETPALHQIQYFNPRDSRNPLDGLLPDAYSRSTLQRYKCQIRHHTKERNNLYIYYYYIIYIYIYFIVNAFLIQIPFTSFFQM